MAKKIKNTINKIPLIYKVGVSFLLLLVLLNIPPTFSPPAFGKSIAFRIVFSSLLLLFLYDVFFKKNIAVFSRVVAKLKTKKSFAFYTPIILTITLLISIFFSVDPNFSIFGNPSRGGGFLNFFSLIIFSYFLFFLIKKEEWKIVWNTLFVTGVIATLFAVLQWQGLLGSIIIETASRPYASFGNPTILGAYLSILVYPVLALLLQEKGKVMRFVYLTGLSIIIFGTLLTYTRAAIIGIALGALYFALFLPKKEKVFQFIKIGLLSVIILSSFVVYYVNTSPLPEFVEESDFLRGLTGRLMLERALEDPRIGGFIIGWNSILEKPLTGYGVENFSYAFDRHYHPHAPFIDRDIPWWDKAHNLPIEIGTWGGFPAMIALLLIFGSLFFVLKKKNDEEDMEKHVMRATLITFFAANFFTVDDFTTYLLFAVIIAYILTLTTEEDDFDIKKELEKREKIAPYKYPFLVAGTLLLFFFISNYNMKLLEVNKNITIAEAHQQQESCERALHYAKEATSVGTPIDSYLFFKKSLILNSCIEDEEERRLRVFEATQKVADLRPTYIRGLTNLGNAALGLITQTEDKKELLETSLESFARAIEISPHRAPNLANYSLLLINNNSFKEALAVTERCLLLEENPVCLFSKGVVLFVTEEDDYANYFDKARELDHNIVRGLNSILNYHIYTENYEAMIPFYLLLIEEEPENAQHYSSIATVYRELEDYAKAREYALKALEVQPEAALVVNAFLETLK